MGTSSDRTAGRGGAWTPLKHATTSYMRGLTAGSPNTRSHAERLLARHVPVLGGAAAAAAGALAGRNGLQRLGSLLAGASENGLGDSLTSSGLGNLIGQNRFDVLDELITFIAGTGDDLDSEAARDAACDVLDEIFGDADSWNELSESVEATVTHESLKALLEAFLSQYVYNRVPVIAERLGRITDPVAAQRADAEMRQIIREIVALRLPADPFVVDWAGAEGRRIAEDTMLLTYQALADLDGESP